MPIVIGKPYKAIDPLATTSGTVKDVVDDGKIIVFYDGVEEYRIPYCKFVEYFERMPEDPVAP